MSAVMNQTDAGLCDSFDMLVERLGFCEDILRDIKAAACYVDSHRNLGDSFLGINMCGHCVELRIHNSFDIDGTFIVGSSNDILLIILDEDPTSDYNTFNMPESEWKWDTDLRSVWGYYKYEYIRARMAQFEAELELGYCSGYPPDIPTCQELGMVSGYRDFYHECYNTALQNRVPGLLAVGVEGFAISLCDIRSAVRTAATIFRLLDKTPFKSLETLEIFRVSEVLKPLALAMLKEYGVDEAWKALPERTRNSVLCDIANPNTFFTGERLQGCH